MNLQDSELEYQCGILQGVSRTFALTIPELPGELRTVVGNAYLLCRIADTIEDEPSLDAGRKRYFADAFSDVLAGEFCSRRFAAELYPRLSSHTPGSEKDLVLNTPRVVGITAGFSPRQRRALQRCVRIMSRGMAEFQQNPSLAGLDDLSHLDRYCYHVAGVVGEMLTELFCDYSAEIDRHREELMRLSLSFGQGLQMTNILKDMWEDRARGACWLPRDLFFAAGVDLEHLSVESRGEGFSTGLVELIALARNHLVNALEYTLLLPRREKGIRRFCLLALGMALLTLQKTYANLGFTAGRQVKISRGSVYATVGITSVAAGSDALLRILFELLARRLPESTHYRETMTSA